MSQQTLAGYTLRAQRTCAAAQPDTGRQHQMDFCVQWFSLTGSFGAGVLRQPNHLLEKVLFTDIVDKVLYLHRCKFQSLYTEHRWTPLTCLGGTCARKWESTTLRASLFPPDCRTGWCEFGHRAELINTNLLSAAITLTLQHQPPLPCLLPTTNNVKQPTPASPECQYSPVSQTRVFS